MTGLAFQRVDRKLGSLNTFCLLIRCYRSLQYEVGRYDGSPTIHLKCGKQEPHCSEPRSSPSAAAPQHDSLAPPWPINSAHGQRRGCRRPELPKQLSTDIASTFFPPTHYFYSTSRSHFARLMRRLNTARSEMGVLLCALRDFPAWASCTYQYL